MNNTYLTEAGLAQLIALVKTNLTALEDGIPDLSYIYEALEGVEDEIGELILDKDVYTREEVDTLFEAISNFKIVVLDELPDEDDAEENTLYIVPSETAKNKNVHEEYLFVDGQFELIGHTAIDFENFYDKDETYSQEEIIAYLIELTPEEVDEIWEE